MKKGNQNIHLSLQSLKTIIQKSKLIFLLCSISFVLSSCEIFTIGGDYAKPEPQIELKREIPDGMSLLYLAEINRKNFRAASRMHYLPTNESNSLTGKSLSTPKKRLSMLMELKHLAESIKYSDSRKILVLNQQDQNARTMIITERSDTLEFRLVKINKLWYVSQLDYRPYNY